MKKEQVFLYLPEQASSVAGQIDTLAIFIAFVSGFFTILIAAMLIYFGVKYRRRAGHESVGGSTKHGNVEFVWMLPPLIFGMIMFGWGASLAFDLAEAPKDSLNYYVVGKQWMWKIQHSDPNGVWEINTLHVPKDRPVKMIMISEDVIHDFYLPAMRVKQDVLPGRYSTLWFTPTKVGEYHLFCAEYCGTEHSKMIGKVIVMEQNDYEDWLRSNATRSDRTAGEALFKELKCISCHNSDGQSYAPSLQGVHGREVRLSDGQTVVADETYLTESILNPDAKVVAGYEARMPAYGDQLDRDQVNQLLAYIRWLRDNPMRKRVDEMDPPLKEVKKKE